MLYLLHALNKLAQEIFNAIYNALYNSTFLLNSKSDIKELSMVKNLAKYDSLFNRISVAERTNATHIPTGDLVKIIS
jgi:hypothetical protein